MTEELDLITFDAGGTLFDMQPSRDEVFVRILTERFEGLDGEQIVAVLRKADRVFDQEFASQDGKNEDSFWLKYDGFVFGELGLGTDLAGLHKELSSAFDDIIPKVDSWVEYPETTRILEGLRGRDFALGVISNATSLTKRVLDNLGLTRYFDFVVVSEEVGFRKPAAEIFQIAAKRAKASPNRSLHVGDKYSVDVVGARRAGMNAILVDRAGVYDDLDCVSARSLDFFSAFVLD